jgi:uncharacterized integral membrane protein
LCSFETNTRSIIIACTRRREKSFATEFADKKKTKKKSISLLRTANKDIACLRSTVSSLDAKVTFEVRETDFTERCRFKLSVLATDAFALMWMDWTIEAIIIVFIFACCYEDDEDVALVFVFARKDFPLIFGLIFPSASFFLCTAL